MVRGMAVLAAAGMSLFVPNVPVGTAVTMALAAIVGMAATRLHAHAEARAAFERALASETLRRARFCDDAALALCVLAVLFALPLPF